MNSLYPDIAISEDRGDRPAGEGAATWESANRITIKACEEAIMILCKYRG